MIDYYILFYNAEFVGKISLLVKKVSPGQNISNLISTEQLPPLVSDNSVLITNNDAVHECLDQNIPLRQFGKVIVIDEIEDNDIMGIDVNSIDFVNIKLQLITNLSSLLRNFLKDYLGHNEYIAFPIEKFNAQTSYPCDLFLKLSQTKYIKILNSDNHLAEDVIQKYKLKEISFLYISSNSYESFSKVLYNTSSLTNKDTQKAFEKLDATEALHSFMNDFGLDEKIIKLTSTLQSNIEEKYTSKFMGLLFDRFKNMEGSFLFNHSFLTSVIALSVGKKLTWMNAENKEKIYLGCILHDLGYIEKDNALKENLSLSDIKKLDPKVAQDILDHPIKFARKLSQLDDIHQDVIKIVRDHHGVMEEESYPKQIYNSEVNLIFALFVISHEFALGLYKISFNKSKIPELINSICERFNKGNYKKIIPEFRQTIDEQFLSDFDN